MAPPIGFPHLIKMPEIQRLNTVGAIADRLDLKVHQVVYLVRKLSLRPIGKAGIANVYSDQHVKQIAATRDQIKAAS
jgi:hypothetical protein